MTFAGLVTGILVTLIALVILLYVKVDNLEDRVDLLEKGIYELRKHMMKGFE